MEHYWNGSWGRLTRRDLRLYEDEAGWHLHVKSFRADGVLDYGSEEESAREQLDVLLADKGPWTLLRV